jgi:hypothetical protein
MEATDFFLPFSQDITLFRLIYHLQIIRKNLFRFKWKNVINLISSGNDMNLIKVLWLKYRVQEKNEVLPNPRDLVVKSTVTVHLLVGC